MFPPITATDFADRLEADTKPFGQLRQFQFAASDLKHISLAELGLAVSFSEGSPASFRALGHVGEFGSQVQATGVYANRTITPVQDEQVVRYGPVVDAVRNPRSQDVSGARTKKSVPVSICHASPVPTSFFGRATRHEPGKCFGLRKATRSIVLDDCDTNVASLSPSLVMRMTPPSSGCRSKALLHTALGGEVVGQN